MKKRRTSKRVLYITLSVMIISVFTLTIAYAVLSTTLNITGSAEISGSSWNISINKVNLDERFPNSWWLTGEMGIMGKYNDNSLLAGNGKILSNGTITNTSVNDISISLTTPGDIVVPVYEITNNGSIPAMLDLDSIVENEKVITSSSNNAADIQLISQYVVIQLGGLYPEDILDNGLPSGDERESVTLCPGESFYIFLICEFKREATAVPSSDITISNIGATLNFVQADKSVCSNS